MKLSIVLLVLLVAGCGKGGPEKPVTEYLNPPLPNMTNHPTGTCSSSISGNANAWITMRERGACVPADANSKMQGDIAEGFNDLLQSVDALKDENAKLKAEVAYLRHLEELSRNTSGTIISIHDSSGFFCRVHPDEEIIGVVGVCDEKRAAEDAKRP